MQHVFILLLLFILLSFKRSTPAMVTATSFKHTVICGFVVIAFLTGSQMAEKRVVEAERLTLRDSKGNVRGGILMSEKGPLFFLTDQAGRGQAKLVLDESGVVFELGTKDKIQMRMETNDEGAAFRIVSKETDRSAHISLSKKGNAQLRLAGLHGVIEADSGGPQGISVKLLDNRGKDRIALKVFEDKAGVVIFDDKGVRRGSLGTEEGKAGVVLFDQEGAARVRLVGEAERPFISLTDGKKARALLFSEKEGSGLVLFDGQEKPRVVAGLSETVSVLSVRDRKGTERIKLSTDDKTAEIRSFDEHGKPIISKE